MVEVGENPIVAAVYFGGYVGLEKLNGAVDEKHLRIRRFVDRINLGLVILVGCALYEVNGVTKDVADHNFGYYLWDPGSI